jgi:hypothetical protein
MLVKNSIKISQWYLLMYSGYETNTMERPALDKSTLMKTFNKHFFDFLDDMIRIFPENEDLEAAKGSFETFRKANPTILIKVWYSYVTVPYAPVIENGDISFFYEKDYSSDLASLQNNGKVMEVIDTLREPLKNMGEVNQQHATKYIQNLCKLSKMWSM